MPMFDVELSHPQNGSKSLVTVDAIDEDDARDEATAERKGYRVIAVKPAVARPREIPIPKPGDTFTPGQGMIICPNPNCGYRGPARKHARGNTFVLIFLLLFFIVPGLLYLLFFRGWRYYCPRCGMQIATDATG